MANIDELSLIQRIKKGDEKAFEIIYKSYYASLCVYAKKFTLQTEASREIVQNIFYKLWEKKEEIEIQKSLKSYLFRAVHNNSLKYLNSRKFDEDYRKFNEDMIMNKKEFIPDFDLKEKLNSSIDELPPQCKKIFIMSRLDNLKHLEIAQQLGISEKTVEVQIRRANIALRKHLRDFSL